MLPKIKTILLAATLGEQARPAARMALSLAKSYKAKIVVVHALEPLGAFGHYLVESYLPKKTLKKLEKEGYQRVIKEMEERLSKLVKEEIAELGAAQSVISKFVVDEGPPANVILDEAKRRKADIIVMGSQGDGLTDTLIGSSARHVTREAKVPVLVVPPG